ncbi:Canalicular multispecific organic anion transporter 1 [Halocaridina rubra]|uniref:Canalicular multispecific organic anion transporter 1 n=1 Tax=Halocaridina rubra TaxID=373956 RepID=A0AAN8ZTM0_HALRR
MKFHITVLPTTVAHCIQANVSLKRLGRFMNSTNIDESCVCQDSEEDSAIAISGGSFSWGVINDEEQPWKLKNVDISVGHGNLVAVVGSVGSGKSSLISSILGEMQNEAGRVVVNGNVAYVSQQAWLQNATLKDNIIWGEPFNKKRYENVLEACALKPDLEMLPGGDLTEIGEKGINLSGGQKQRISLARAAYSNADIMLLDDPLSAVDAHVGRHIFQNLIGPKGLMKGKTRVLVTHAIWVLPQVSEIFVIKDGMLVERGSYSQLLKQEGDFAHFLLQHISTHENEVSDDEELDELCNQLEDPMNARALLRRLSREGSKKEEGKFSQYSRRRRLTSTSSSKRQSESESEMHSSIKSLQKLTSSDMSRTGDKKKDYGHDLIQQEKVEIGKM